MADQKPGLLSAAEKIFNADHFESIIPWRHAYVTDGIAQSAGIRVLIARAFHAGDLAANLQREKRGHQFGVAVVEKDEIVAEFGKRVLLTGL